MRPRLWWRASVLVALSGCGVPQMLGQTASAIVSPVTSLVQSTSAGLNTTMGTVGQTVSNTSVQMASAARDSSANMAQSISTTRDLADAAAPTMSYPQQSLTSDQKAAIQQGKKNDQPDLTILPDETLAKLTDDQRGLQNAAQKDAFTAPVGQTIFWDQDGRSGTVFVKDEHKMGQTLCRNFEQSVTIDGKDEKAHAIACRDSDSGHWALAF